MKNSTLNKLIIFQISKTILAVVFICIFFGNSNAQVVDRIGSVNLLPATKTACVPASGTATVSYTITAQRFANGTVNGTYTVLGLPAGVTASAIAGFTATGNTAFPNRTLTLTISTSAVPSTTTFYVRIADGADEGIGKGILVLNTRPTVSVADIAVPNDPGMCGSSQILTAVSNGTLSYQISAAAAASPYLFPVGTTKVTAIGTNTCGNTKAYYNVTVSDIEKPVISSSPSMTLNNDASGCGAIVTYSLRTSDNCQGETIQQTAGLASGSLFPIGTTTNSFIVTDAAGNTASHSFDVTVSDVEKPVLTVPADITKAADGLRCSSKVIYEVLHSDNCTNAVLTQIAGLPSGASFPLGITKNTFKVTDAAGHSAIASFHVTITSDLAIDAGADEQTFFGFSQDQTVTRTAAISGGSGTYKIDWMMNRPLLCNQTADGDEMFASGNCVYSSCPVSGSLPIHPACTGSATMTATLMQPAEICVYVKDAFGCKKNDCFIVEAKDVRCSTAGTTLDRVSVCKHTGSTKNAFVQLCLPSAAAASMLANNPSSYLGDCARASGKTDETIEENTIPTPSGEFSVNVYPNPANDMLNLEFETASASPYQAQIFDNLGRRVFNNEGETFEDGNRLAVSVGHLAPGFYYLNLNVGDRLSSVKVLITR